MYSVIASDGKSYGPVDVATLKLWVGEGRVTPETNLVDSASGRTLRASDLTELSSVFGPPRMASAPAQPLYSEAGPIQTGATGNPYANAPSSPYFRGGGMAAVNDADLRGFNWGAFFLTWIWGLNHKKPILLLVLVVGFVPFVGGRIHLGLAIWIGSMGNRWAWESGRFRTLDDMRATERVWTAWGVGILIAGLIVGIIAAVLFFALAPHNGVYRTYP